MSKPAESIPVLFGDLNIVEYFPFEYFLVPNCLTYYFFLNWENLKHSITECAQQTEYKSSFYLFLSSQIFLPLY